MRPINSFHELEEAFACFDAGEISEERFDDVVAILLSYHLFGPQELATAPEEVALWYAARTMEFDVGNGGFPQAAYNIPDWFGWSAAGYRALGLPDAASLVDQAARLLPQARKGFTAIDIGGLFTQFRESKLAALDARLDDVGWWALEARIAYLKANRDVFIRSGFDRPRD